MPDLPTIIIDSDGLITNAVEATNIATQSRQQQVLGMVKLVTEKLAFPEIFDGGTWTN